MRKIMIRMKQAPQARMLQVIWNWMWRRRTQQKRPAKEAKKEANKNCIALYCIYIGNFSDACIIFRKVNSRPIKMDLMTFKHIALSYWKLRVGYRSLSIFRPTSQNHPSSNFNSKVSRETLSHQLIWSETLPSLVLFFKAI